LRAFDHAPLIFAASQRIPVTAMRYVLEMLAASSVPFRLGNDLCHFRSHKKARQLRRA